MAHHYNEFTWQSGDGLDLYAKDWPYTNSPHPPLLCLAGLTRNSNDFDQLAHFLSVTSTIKRRVISMDYRGRGKSDYDPDSGNYSFERELMDIIQGLDALGLDTVDIIGTSRGGIHIMLLASLYPDRVGRAILNDIGPEIPSAGLNRISQYVGKKICFSNFEQAAEHLKSREGASFPNLSAEDWYRFAKQTYQESNTGIVLNYDPKLADIFQDQSDEAKSVDLWPQFSKLQTHKILVIRGELSDILTPETTTKMKAAHPDMKLYTVASQGHAPLLFDQEIIATIDNFLANGEGA
ncbi:MAG: alpha/beta hydrolase [Stappiaceae bacterium]